ncbi:hypothetical protein EUGRSUZ_F00317 [Eucalyptus grandis]|uniref:Uncharacterized protein n=2 Tax=Eucalyptus grandis TaxID=71139 RepID=A0A059BJX8_EUCGR|nr:hypothetical protein EUGRSUZ_F00317 [Eucalyptus grandis]
MAREARSVMTISKPCEYMAIFLFWSGSNFFSGSQGFLDLIFLRFSYLTMEMHQQALTLRRPVSSCHLA